ncbi:MAG: succinate dehydrogenase cytochrome b subunit [Chthoniobacterales bacterium]|nr:succinate dehydrogenase cytochrome b subunit [Chthoniobacterales bacterium]
MTSSSQKKAPSFFASSIGKKWVVALTGVLLIGFITLHLLGNLAIFLGPEAINSYSEKLHHLGVLLWIVRLGLLVVAGLHVFFTMALWRENKKASLEKYAVRQKLETTLYARSMRLSGLVVLGFVLFHLAQFTWELTNPDYKNWMDALGRHDVYRMLISAFSNLWVAGFYLLSVGLLALHLAHGVASLFQTLGLTSEKLRPRFERVSLIVAVLFFLGYASIPLAVFFKVVS